MPKIGKTVFCQTVYYVVNTSSIIPNLLAQFHFIIENNVIKYKNTKLCMTNEK